MSTPLPRPKKSRFSSTLPPSNRLTVLLAPSNSDCQCGRGLPASRDREREGSGGGGEKKSLCGRRESRRGRSKHFRGSNIP